MTTIFPKARLGSFLRHRKEFFTLDDTARYKRVRIQLHNKGIVLRDIVEGSELRTKKQQAVKAGDLLVAEIDAKVGGFGTVLPDLEGAIVSSHYFLYEIDETACQRGWLDAFIRAGGLEDQVKARGTTNYAAIRPEQVLEFEIPLPPLAEQRRIVARIEELAAKIDETRNLRYKAIEQTASFVSSVHLYLAATRTVALGDILLLDEQREPVTPGREYPQVGIKGFGGGLFLKPAVSFTDTTYKTFNRLYAGALVLSQVKGWEGAVAVCPPELAGSYASPEYRTFRCANGKVLPEYLAFVAVTPWFWTKLKTLTRGVGARRERTRPERFLEMKMEMPTLENQKKGLLAFQGVDPLKHLQAETAAELDVLLPSILDKAFRGEL